MIAKPLLAELASPKREFILDGEIVDKLGVPTGARLGKAFMHLERSLGHGDSKALHGIRHGVAAMLAAEPVQEHTIAAILGHKLRGVTAHYLKTGITLKLKREAIEKLNYPEIGEATNIPRAADPHIGARHGCAALI